ncbi:MAG: FKBP-type peptidyl-prolyl cis-trans isomerase [Phycisphaeraceae bacterium JB051]
MSQSLHAQTAKSNDAKDNIQVKPTQEPTKDQPKEQEPDIPWVEIQPGLSYQVTKEGTGDRKVLADDIVVITYSAKVKNADTYFAATKPQKGYQFQIDKSNVLPGIKLGIIGMKIGELRKIEFVSKYGFGNRPATGVPVGSAIVVNVQMHAIQTPVKWTTRYKGKGTDKAQNGDLLRINYVGKLEDGTVFDSNFSAISPFTFALGSKNVIKGLNIGCEGIMVGEKRSITIPPIYAYGDQPRPNIPPNSTLIFDVTCKAIENGVVYKTIKKSKGRIIKDNETGEFALRIEGITGRVYHDTQFKSPLKLTLNDSLNPYGIYFLARGMRVGEVRQGTIKPELGFSSGKDGAGKPLNITLDLIRIVEKHEKKLDSE